MSFGNPLSTLDPGRLEFYDAAAAIADALIEIETGPHQHWPESARNLLAALIMYEATEARN